MDNSDSEEEKKGLKASKYSPGKRSNTVSSSKKKSKSNENEQMLSIVNENREVEKASKRSSSKKSDNKKNIDLKKYMGKWYEIARYPQSYEDKDGVNVVAYYEVEKVSKEGEIRKIKVVNYEEVRGKDVTREGHAKPGDSPNELIVDIGGFKADKPNYIIEVVGCFGKQNTEYDYSIVSNGKHTGLWILARKYNMSAYWYGRILEVVNKIQDGAYDSRLLVTTPHTKYSTVVQNKLTMVPQGIQEMENEE